MAIDVPLPSYSESMEEADVIGWLVALGDHVNQGDPIAEIETDKATGELEAPVSGVLVEICVAEGTAGVKVGAVVARIEAAEDVADSPTIPEPQSETLAPPRNATETLSEAGNAKQTPTPEGEAQPDVALATADLGTEAHTAAPSVQPASAAVPATALARRLAEQQGVDLQELQGTGHRGRITKADVEAAQPTASPSAPGLSIGTGSFARLEVDCRVERALEVCAQLGEREGREAISLTAVIVRAAAMALQEIPEVNGDWDGTTFVAGSSPAIRVEWIAAGASDETPPGNMRIHEANRKSLATISEIMESGPPNSAEPSDPSAAHPTEFRILDLGALGVERVQPDLEPPAVGSLGVGAPASRLIVDDASPSGSRLISVISCCLVIQAQAVTAYAAARWLQNFRRRVEDPLEMLL